MSEIRDKSHALIFTGKKDTPLYKIKKDIKEIKNSIKNIESDIEEIKNILKCDKNIPGYFNYTGELDTKYIMKDGILEEVV